MKSVMLKTMVMEFGDQLQPFKRAMRKLVGFQRISDTACKSLIAMMPLSGILESKMIPMKMMMLNTMVMSAEDDLEKWTRIT